MAQYTMGSAASVIPELIRQGGIKNKFVAKIVEDLIKEKTQMSINMELLEKKNNELELELLEIKNKANKFKKTIIQTHGYDTNRRDDDIVRKDNGGGESKTNDEVRSDSVRSDGVRSDSVMIDEVERDNLTEDDKTILRENFIQEFGWDVPPNKKNDFPWIIEKIKNSKKYREEYRKRQKYRKNKQDNNKRKDEIGGPWRP